MVSVFLCHNSKDKPFVRKLGRIFTDYGIKVWLDEAEINIGDSVIRKISEAVDAIDFLIAVLSNNSIESKWVQQELEMVYVNEISIGRPIVIPIKIQEINLPPKLNFLRGKRFCDLSNAEKYDQEFSILLRTLGISAGVAPSLSNLDLFNILDLARDESDVYLLATQNSGNGNYFIDPEGAKKFESYLYVIRISKDGTVTSNLLSRNMAFDHGAIKILDTMICAFANYKTLQVSFGMNGMMNYLPKDMSRKTTKTVFSDKNWGWFPTIIDKDTVEHFSFSGHHRCLNDAALNEPNFNANEFINKQTEERTIHSRGWLPGTDDAVIEKVLNWVAQK